VLIKGVRQGFCSINYKKPVFQTFQTNMKPNVNCSRYCPPAAPCSASPKLRSTDMFLAQALPLVMQLVHRPTWRVKWASASTNHSCDFAAAIGLHGAFQI